jgi:serine/threonine protein kinase/predicted Zn-dependent protease
MDSTVQPTIDEDARRRFEAAWSSGRPEPVEHFLPPPDVPHFLATLEELLLIDLEFAWKSHRNGYSDGATLRPPVVEGYLTRFPCLNRADIVLRLLRQEYQVRQEYGDRPDSAEYRRRFPQFVVTGAEVETLASRAGGGGSAALQPPAIPGYEMLGVLGQGGMGVVYRARQLSLNRIVALKMVRRGGLAGDEELARFQTEAEAVAQLQHPNIVQIFDVGTHDGQPFCALEFVAGGSLSQQLAGTPQPPRAAAELVETLARAMHFAHERGIVHRDLKPANVLLVSGGVVSGEWSKTAKPQAAEKTGTTTHHSPLTTHQPKVTDFGLAKRLEADTGQTQSGAILGTPSYMAPEQAAHGKTPIGPAADVYGLGAILYECLTGRPPFKAGTVFDTIQQVLTEDPVPPARLQSKVPRDLETICLKCLRKLPAQRYATAAALADDLGRFRRGEPIVARPVGRAVQALKWARRRPAQAALLAAVALLLVGAVAALFVWQHLEQQRLQQAFEHEQDRRQQEQRRAAYLDKRRDGARKDTAAAQLELKANRFDQAEQMLRRAVDSLGAEPELAGLRDQLEDRRMRAEQLAKARRLGDRAEWLAFNESDAEGVATCQACLKVLGVLDRGPDWPRYLADRFGQDLEPQQLDAVGKQVNGAFVLWAALRARQGLLAALKQGASPADRERAKQCFRSVRGVLESVQDSERWHMCHLLRVACKYLGGQQDLELRADPTSGPPFNGYDHYAMGILHYSIAANAALPAAGKKDEDSVYAALRLLSRMGFKGLDLANPQAQAERLLRKAIELEPQHYWSHFWLGWCLMRGPELNSWHHAEMAFTRCIELHPGNAFGYLERGNQRFRMWQWSKDPKVDAEYKKNNAKWFQELERRMDEDMRFALERAPDNPLIHWRYANMLWATARPADSLRACARAAELEPPLRTLDGRTIERQSGLAAELKAGMKSFTDHQAKYPEAWSVVALACWLLDDDEAALASAATSLQKTPDHPRALAVRAAVALKQGRHKQALADCEQALRRAPHSNLAAAGRARALEALGRPAAALAAYTALLADPAAAETDWQRLEAHLGRARNLAALGREAEARRALALADETDPEASAALAKTLFPREPR